MWLTHFSHWCFSAWIPLVKEVINSRYDVMIWTFQPLFTIVYIIYIYIYTRDQRGQSVCLFLCDFLEVRAKNKAPDYFNQLVSLFSGISKRKRVKISYYATVINNSSMVPLFSWKLLSGCRRISGTKFAPTLADVRLTSVFGMILNLTYSTLISLHREEVENILPTVKKS